MPAIIKHNAGDKKLGIKKLILGKKPIQRNKEINKRRTPTPSRFLITLGASIP